jgi:hypothetical protein
MKLTGFISCVLATILHPQIVRADMTHRFAAGPESDPPVAANDMVVMHHG